MPATMESLGNEAQITAIVERIGEAAIKKLMVDRPELFKQQPVIPKWVTGTVAAVLGVFLSTGGIWMVSSISDMKVTLARMDERQQAGVTSQTARFQDVERRVTTLESYHNTGSPRPPAL